VENVSSINVCRTVNEIMQQSSILNEMIENGEIGICGAMYNVETGVVDFYTDTMIIKNRKLSHEAIV
jgi:carbonic anhydrase